MQYPYLSDMSLDRQKDTPLYLQIASAISSLIKRGLLKPGQKLPGTRLFAQKLAVHRSTLMLALDELQAEGWLQSREKSGWYVHEKLPLTKKAAETGTQPYAIHSGVEVIENQLLDLPIVSHLPLQFNDGFPDFRIAPLAEFGRAYSAILKSPVYNSLFTYTSPQGDDKLREVYSKILRESRALQVSDEQLMICRGSIMGMYLLSEVLFRTGDKVVVGEINYRTANLIFQHNGAQLLSIPLDEQGIQTERLEELLRNHHIRAVYVTSHHHHPTTVPLAPHRRLHLYQLAQKHRFFIIEDDYDYEFHYDHKPLMPIASMDEEGLVVYIGSFSKLISPAIRIGFVVTSQNIMTELIKLRRVIDRQGNNMEERALAELLSDGTIKRFTRKALQIYRERRDYFCQLLQHEIGEAIHFQCPEGGMAVWATFDKSIALAELSAACAKRKLYLSDGKFYNTGGRSLNACRMGFASMNFQEMEQAVHILKEEISRLKTSVK